MLKFSPKQLSGSLVWVKWVSMLAQHMLTPAYHAKVTKWFLLISWTSIADNTNVENLRCSHYLKNIYPISYTEDWWGAGNEDSQQSYLRIYNAYVNMLIMSNYCFISIYVAIVLQCCKTKKSFPGWKLYLYLLGQTQGILRLGGRSRWQIWSSNQSFFDGHPVHAACTKQDGASYCMAVSTFSTLWTFLQFSGTAYRELATVP